MTATKTSKIAAWGAGSATGVIGITNIAMTINQHHPGQSVPLEMWVLLVAGIAATTFLTAVTMLLHYLDSEPYRRLLTEAALHPKDSAHYAEIIDADSRHEAIKNREVLIDRQQEKLYRPGKPQLPPGSLAGNRNQNPDAPT